MRRDGDIAPYRHYARVGLTRITPPACAPRTRPSRAPSETLKITRPGLPAFVLLYIPSLRSLCPSVLIIRTLALAR